jgi:hypothetical protein
MQTLFASGGKVEVSGAVATDGNTVFWILEATNQDDQLVSCPVTGCPGNVPNVVWEHASWGGPGGLVVSGGRVYFQEANINDSPVTGPILDCPVSGCGAAPSTFVPKVTNSGWEPPFGSDGSDLYWVDDDTIYACAFGETCASPRVVTTLAPRSWLAKLAVFDGNIYWVDNPTKTVETVPARGGSVTKLCTIPDDPDGWVAAVGGYAYASVNDGSADAGVYRCELGVASGAAKRFLADSEGAAQITTDGTSLFWMSNVLDPEDGAWPYVARCAPGTRCEGKTNIGSVFSEPNENTGFVLFGGSAYGAGASVVRTAFCP